jgi:hypothetical protein
MGYSGVPWALGLNIPEKHRRERASGAPTSLRSGSTFFRESRDRGAGAPRNSVAAEPIRSGARPTRALSSVLLAHVTKRQAEPTDIPLREREFGGTGLIAHWNPCSTEFPSTELCAKMMKPSACPRFSSGRLALRNGVRRERVASSKRAPTSARLHHGSR